MSVTALFDRLLERRINARQVGVARVGVALAVLLGWASSAETLPRLANPELLRVPYVDWLPDPDPPVVSALLVAWLAAGLVFLVGWQTRVAGAVLTATLASVLFIDQQMYNNYLYLMVLSVGLLTVADSGAAVSLDARLRGARETIPAWPVFLLCVQVSIVYGFAALAKLNLDFLSGSVLASYLRRDGPLAVPDAWRKRIPEVPLDENDPVLVWQSLSKLICDDLTAHAASKNQDDFHVSHGVLISFRGPSG